MRVDRLKIETVVWHPVPDDLPDYSGKVLVSIKVDELGLTMVDVGYYDKTGFRMRPTLDSQIWTNVTSWSDLPKGL